MESPIPSGMKSEDTVEEENTRHLEKLALQEEIEMLKGDLEREQTLKEILKTALQGPAVLPPSDCSLIPRQIQVLLAELVLEEEQIITLERKVRELKLSMFQETKQSRKLDLHRRRKQLQYKDEESENDEKAPAVNRTQDTEKAMSKSKTIRDRITFSGSLLGRQNPASSATADEESLYCILPKRNPPKVVEGNNMDIRRWLPKLTYLNLNVTKWGE